MARVAGLERLLVGVLKLFAVLLVDRGFDRSEGARVDGVEDRLQIDGHAIGPLRHGIDANQPPHVIARFAVVIVGERPVLGLSGEPEVGPVERHVGHRHRRGRRLVFQICTSAFSAAISFSAASAAGDAPIGAGCAR